MISYTFAVKFTFDGLLVIVKVSTQLCHSFGSEDEDGHPSEINTGTVKLVKLPGVALRSRSSRSSKSPNSTWSCPTRAVEA